MWNSYPCHVTWTKSSHEKIYTVYALRTSGLIYPYRWPSHARPMSVPSVFHLLHELPREIGIPRFFSNFFSLAIGFCHLVGHIATQTLHTKLFNISHLAIIRNHIKNMKSSGLGMAYLLVSNAPSLHHPAGPRCLAQTFRTRSLIQLGYESPPSWDSMIPKSYTRRPQP